MDIERLRRWFSQNKRIFPWRGSPSAYEVWISEVMLQQTQSARVISYYSAWMQKFPTIEALACATQEEVLKTWEGLGYYSRARALHTAAQTFVRDFNATIPSCKETLLSISGLGSYTVGAILSFAFHKKEPAIDANVVRVLTRFFAHSDDISKPKTYKALYALCEKLLPEERPWEIVEALIELGAVVCQKKPLCGSCPLNNNCRAHGDKTQAHFPVKSQKICYEKLYREVCVIVSEDQKLLVRKGKEGIACSGLYEFSFFDCGPDGFESLEVQSRIKNEFALDAELVCHLDEQKQSFTRYRVTLYPKLFTAKKRTVLGHEWQSLQEARLCTFSSGHKKILGKLEQYFAEV